MTCRSLRQPDTLLVWKKGRTSWYRREISSRSPPNSFLQRSVRAPGQTLDCVSALRLTRLSSPVAAYVDGFNLYHGMRSAHGRRYHWLNLEAACSALLRTDQVLVSVKYFTARVRRPTASQERQNVYLDALTQTTRTEAIFGRLQLNDVTCKTCGASWRKPEEKKTDVAIASHLVADGYEDRYDAAMLITGDSDIVPPVEIVKSIRGKRVIIASPPHRQSEELKRLAGAATYLSEKTLRASQLPTAVVLPAGITLTRPTYWH